MPLVSRFFLYLFIVTASLLSSNYAYSKEFKIDLLNDNDGFSSSIIFSIVQDRQGYLWFGTGYNGIFRYDGKRVVAFQHDDNDATSLAHNYAGNLSLDSSGNIWIGSWGGGVSVYHADSSSFTQYQYDANNPQSISDKYVQSIFQNNTGVLWFGTFSKGLNKFNEQQQTFTRYPYNDLTGKGSSGERIWAITQTDKRGLWIGTSKGLNYFDKLTSTFQYYFPDPGIGKQGKNKIRHLLTLNKQQLLLGTDNGLLRFDIASKTFRPVPVESNQFVGEIYSIIKTSFNDIWVASASGLYHLPDYTGELKKLDLGIDDHCSQTLFEDSQKIIWLSCEGLGVYKIVPNRTFKLISTPALKRVTSLVRANDGNIILSTTLNGIQKLNANTKKITQMSVTNGFEASDLIQLPNGEQYYTSAGKLFKLLANGHSKPIELPENSPWKQQYVNLVTLGDDQHGGVWVGSDHGLFIYDDKQQSFQYLSTDKQNSLHMTDTYVRVIYRDRQNRMWVGTQKGLNLWQAQTKTFKSYYFDPLNESVDSNNITSIFQDRQGRMWIGSRSGLFLLNDKTDKFTRFGIESGLANDQIGAITEDQSGYIWLLTNLGLSRLNLKTMPYKIKNYDQRDGLSASRYFASNMPQTADGNIYFSSRNGLFYFNPRDIGEFKRDANVVLTNFEVLGKPNTRKLYNPRLTNINLNYDQNYLKFEFAALDFANSRQISYSYKLEGVDSNWINSGTNNQAIYNNLSGGNYTFRVRAAYNDTETYSKELSVHVNIAIPFWQRWWMYLCYGVLLLLAVYVYMQRKVRKQEEEIARQKYFVEQLEIQVKEKTASIEQESRKLAKANNVKSEFLANMSHEIRTPLTAVLGQAEAIIHHEVAPQDITDEVTIIYNNSMYLLQLLNNILDLSKIEANKFELELEPQNLHLILQELSNIFSEQAKAKGLSFSIIHHLPPSFYVNIDSLRLKQVLINLCSNALKFTQEGEVSITILMVNQKLIFKIRDTGIGLSGAQMKDIFNPFTQGDSSISRRFGGSGLGLSLSEKLVKLMGGFISVESTLNQGSVFSVVLPLSILHHVGIHQAGIGAESETDVQYHFIGKVLLAEDHDDNRRLIARWLTTVGFEVVCASNGQEAVTLAAEHAPELILLDIQMPVIDGIEAFRLIRGQGCKVPIIALTANAMTHEITEFLALGFDAHLAKPIDRKKFIATLMQYFTPMNAKSSTNISEHAEQQLHHVDMTDIQLTFINSLATEQANFRKHLQNNALDALQEQAHRLAGATQMFGFKTLFEYAARVELNIKHHQIDDIEEDVLTLIQEIENTLATCQP